MSEERNDKPEAATKDQAATQVGNERRRFLKAAGATVLAVPVMETLSGQGLLVRSARAQSAGGGMGGGIGP